ncbi:hypothetical protein A1O3_03269 [Capronia epimyces CBS 606.96]|uniref:Zn(2)-C6 fungal-type domain-containing protein n=1 Tax=Capronia epimyces CBS 606.96 TaxID=1182542 RepID=W9Y1F9_9EURO|nr:uncharacterized protein A1O3_03269 [Capronia epimyces CBS 606.96]EXJ86318.1 hypothetical protein A1O3_03269 [Capronia epimyces CBS 606.96]
MADSSSCAPPRQRRSRTGCEECRRRHWKCNEAKPACAYCQSVGRPCVYSRQLSWGGRPFKKSRFGKCLDSGARAVTSTGSDDTAATSKDFVYTYSPEAVSSRPRSESSSTTSSNTTVSEQEIPVIATAQAPTTAEDLAALSALHLHVLAVAPGVSPESRPLFDYFVHGMSVSISCHKGIQDELCSAIVPMAVQVPHLLSAVLALAAAHRQTSGLFQGERRFEMMKGKSLQQLRSALDCFNPADNDQLLATTLILCMVEIISPNPSNASWRSHLHGAATLFAHRHTSSRSNLTSASSFLRRKYQALQAIALACGSRRYTGPILLSPAAETAAYIDDLAGFSTNLLPIFRAINDLESSHEMQESDFVCDDPPGPPHFDCHSPVEHQSHLLFDRIQEMLATQKLSRSQQNPGNLPQAIHHDFCLLDEAHHHMAILQVFRRGSLSVPRQVIDDSRRAILAILASISYHSTPCPAVAALPPLFVAGSFCTNPADRDKVRSLLKTLWVNFGMGNVRSCRTVLEKWWRQQDCAVDKMGALAHQSYGKSILRHRSQ